MTKKNFTIILGPSHDLRVLEIELPLEPKKIAVLVSGGLDSAILFYLIKKINYSLNNIHTVTHIAIKRQEGSIEYAPKVIRYIKEQFNEPVENIEFIDPANVPLHLQVPYSVNIAQEKYKFDKIYLGVIETRHEHALGISIPKININSNLITYAFYKLQKSHIIDLICKMSQTELFKITISCDNLSICGLCNGCRERAWGFKEMNVIDQ